MAMIQPTTKGMKNPSSLGSTKITSSSRTTAVSKLRTAFTYFVEPDFCIITPAFSQPAVPIPLLPEHQDGLPNPASPASPRRADCQSNHKSLPVPAWSALRKE